MKKAEALARVRALCLSFPEVNERPSHGAPTFFVRDKRSFLMFLDNHHGDGRLCVWCLGTLDAQAMLVDSDPDVFFVPPYVGHSGWVGVRLDRDAPWPLVARVIEEAYALRAPRGKARAAPAKKVATTKAAPKKPPAKKPPPKKSPPKKSPPKKTVKRPRSS